MDLISQLYIVALPIGNHLDISPRVLDILAGVDCIAAEDTRKIKILAQHHRINLKQVIAHHNHNETESYTGIIDLLKTGKKVALVSDAGTPNVSDPGYKLIRACFENNISVSPIPGPSALTSILSVCPLGGTDHYFYGFLPSKSRDRIKALKSFRPLASHCSKSVVFESPHRFKACLQEIHETLDSPEVFIGREMSKRFESFYFGNTEEVLNKYPDAEIKGEFVICISLQNLKQAVSITDSDLDTSIQDLLASGLKTKAIQKQLASLTDMSSKDLYTYIDNLAKKNKIREIPET